MNDLDTALRSVACAIVEDAPAPPPFPGDQPTVASPPRRSALQFTAVAALSATIVGIAAAATLVGDDDSTRINASAGDQPSAEAHACGPEPALRVTVSGATAGPSTGAAPGSLPLDAGQRAIHWTRPDGIVELRWPAREPPLYNDTPARVLTLYASESVSTDRAEIDVHPRQHGNRASTVAPDVVINRQEPAAPVPPAPCDLLELTVVTADGRWFGGLRAAASTSLSGMPFETVDLQSSIVERRSVQVAPTSAIPCSGSDRSGRPPNRTGARDRSVGGRRPVDVLLRYLAGAPGAPQSGYVEMTEPDGSVTYGVDPSGDGWTTLVFVASDGDDWYLEGWTASGC